jgi:importin subunit beta-1
MGLVGTAARADIADGPREASLKALGYLLEELDEYEESPLSQQEVDAALTAICGCMAQSSTPVQIAAVSAMFDTLPFVAENFEDAHAAERNAIMMAICSATQNEVQRIKISAFQCIGRIAQIYYDRISDYVKVLAELTATAARSKDDELSCAALDFWNEISQEEADRRENGGENESKKVHPYRSSSPRGNVV